MRELGVFNYFPVDGVLVHHRVTPAFSLPVPIQTLEWRGTVRVKTVLPKNTAF